MNNSAPNSLGTAPIGKLLWQYSLPAITGTMVMSLYNIVDRMFIGQGVGADAISGLALTFPIMNLTAATGMLVGAGASARISIVLGQKDRVWAEKILGNSLILTLAFAAIYVTLFILFMENILMEFGGSANTVPYASEYLYYMLPGMVLTNLCFSFNGMMRASGYPTKAMVTMIIGAVLNVILDPIFIFWLNMGIKGAAVASVISMAVSAFFVMNHFLSKHSYIRFHKHSFKLEKRIIRNIVTIGMSPFLINITASGVNVVFNSSLQAYGGDTAIGAYGIICSYATLIVMLVMGLCQGMQPIVGYNFGANQRERLRKAYLLSVAVGGGFTTLGWVGSTFFPGAIVRCFTNDSELIAVASHGMRCVLGLFPIVGFQIVTTNLFQSIGMAYKSIFLSLSRQVLFLLPLLLFFPRMWGLEGIWYANPVSDIVATVVTFAMIYHQRKLFVTAIKN